jgi:hypothetical protein
MMTAMTSAHPGRSPGQPLPIAAIGGLAFAILYIVHRILQERDLTVPREGWAGTRNGSTIHRMT